MIKLPTPEEMMEAFKKLGMKPVRGTQGREEECCLAGLMACMSEGKQIPFLERCRWSETNLGESFRQVVRGWDGGRTDTPLAKEAAKLAEIAFPQELPI